MASRDLLEEVHAKLTPITVLDVLEINEKYVENDEIRSNGSTYIVDENESPEKNEISTPIRKKKRTLWSQVPHFAYSALQNKQTEVFSYSSVLDMILFRYSARPNFLCHTQGDLYLVNSILVSKSFGVALNAIQYLDLTKKIWDL